MNASDDLAEIWESITPLLEEGFVLIQDDSIIVATPRLCDLLECNSDNITLKTLKQIKSDPPLFDIIKNHNQFPKPHHLLGHIKSSDGETTYLDICIKSAPIQDRDTLLITVTDRSDNVRKNHRDKTLRRLLTHLNMAETPTFVAREALAAAHTLIGYDAAFFGIVANDLFTKDLTLRPIIPVIFQDTINGQLQEIQTNRFALPPTALSYKALSDGPLLIADRRSHNLQGTRRFGADDKSSQSMMFFPIQAGQEKIGIISLHSYTPCEFSEDTLRALGEIALYTSNALNRTRNDKYRRIFEMALAHANDMVLITAQNSEVESGSSIVFVNDAFCTATGYTLEEIVGQSPRQLYGGDASSDALANMKDNLQGGKPITLEVTSYRKDQSTFQSEISAFPISEPDTGTQYYVSIQRDITERKKQEQELTYLAFHDQLTGLPNRQLLNERIERAFGRAQRMNENFAIMYCDLDGFKEINDTHGHAVGDQLLKEVARRLTDSVRPTDTVARLGGDEFVILLEFTPSEALISVVAQRILTHIRSPFLLGEIKGSISISVGIARYRPKDKFADQLIQRADRALYNCKQSGKNCYVFDTDVTGVFEPGVEPND